MRALPDSGVSLPDRLRPAAFVALILFATTLYGSLAFLIAPFQQLYEQLGADTPALGGLVVAWYPLAGLLALLTIALGIAGFVGPFATTRANQRFLFRVASANAAIAVGLLAVIVFAMYLPLLLLSGSP